MNPFAELIDFVVENIPPEQVLAFRTSEKSHSQVYELIEKEKTGYILDHERKELDQFGEAEHIMRVAKIKASQVNKYLHKQSYPTPMAFSTHKEIGDVLLEHQIRFEQAPFVFGVRITAPATLVDELAFTMSDVDYRASEYAVCESLIYPALRAVWKPYSKRLALWSHKALYEDDKLLGIPDYVLTKRSPLGKIVFDVPYLAVIEAKRDDFTGGWGQCMLQMLALRRINNQPKAPVYGIVSNGRNWETGMLQNDVFTLYDKTLLLENLDELMSGLATIFEWCIKNLDDAESANGGS